MKQDKGIKIRVVVTTLSGIVGRTDFHNSYYISILGLVCALVIFALLPDKPVEVSSDGEKKKIRLNRKVGMIALFL